MAKHDRKGRSINPDGKYTPFYEWLLNSPAWCSLDAYAQIVYLHLRRRYNGKNNGAITASTRELCRNINCSDKPVTRALRDLQDRGFIVAIQKGSFNWKTRIDGQSKNRATVWLLTELPQDEPSPERTPRKDFMRWRPTNITAQEKNAVVPERPYGRTRAAISKSMVAPERSIVVSERSFSVNLDSEWSPSYDTYNIPYTPSKNTNGMGG